MLFDGKLDFVACSDPSCLYCHNKLIEQVNFIKNTGHSYVYEWLSDYSEGLLEKRKWCLNYKKEYARHCFHSPHLVTTKNCYVDMSDTHNHYKFDNVETVYMSLIDCYKSLDSRRVYYAEEILDFNKFDKKDWDCIDDLLSVMSDKELIPIIRIEEVYVRKYSYVLR